MKADRVFSEQSKSLVRVLQTAGIEHGDEARLVLEGVGVHVPQSGVPTVAFCPASVLRVNIIRRGTAAERKQPIPATVHLSNRLQQRILQDAPQRGFVRLNLIVRSNGVIHLGGRVTKAESVPEGTWVNAPESYREHQQDLVAAH